MSIYSYENTINSILINENCYDIDYYITESGTNIGQISGFSQLATFMIATAKKVGGKLTGKKNYTSKSIEYQIEKLKKLSNNIDEELEDLKNNNYKIKPSYVAKNFFGCFISLTVATSIESAILIGFNKQNTKLIVRQSLNNRYNIAKEAIDKVSKGNTNFASAAKQGLDHAYIDAFDNSMKSIDARYKAAGITAQKIALVISAIIAAGTTVVILKDYKKSLIDWKKNIDENIKLLEKAHKKALEKESQKSK